MDARWRDRGETHPCVQRAATLRHLPGSFFTFQKIALLVDAYKGRVQHFDPLGYVLFVSFFSHLIAGLLVVGGHIMEYIVRNKIAALLLPRIGLSIQVDCVKWLSDPG